VNPFRGMSLTQLQNKRWLANMIIKACLSEWSDDPRSEEALVKYRGQHKQLNEAILAKKQGAGPLPEPTKVKMKPLTMSGKAPRA